jgi:hypothetical protein
MTFSFTASLIWFGSQFWYQVVSDSSRSQLWGVEPWFSLPNSALVPTLKNFILTQTIYLGQIGKL